MAALGLVMTAVATALDLPVDEVTLTEAFPSPVPFIEPVQPARANCPGLMIMPAMIANPMPVQRRIVFFMMSCVPSHFSCFRFHLVLPNRLMLRAKTRDRCPATTRNGDPLTRR